MVVKDLYALWHKEENSSFRVYDETGNREICWLWPKDPLPEEAAGLEVVSLRGLYGDSFAMRTRPAPVREVKVLIDGHGIFQGAYVTPGLADIEVELIDFSVSDEDEANAADARFSEAARRAQAGELEFIVRTEPGL